MNKYYCDRCGKDMGQFQDDNIILPAKPAEYINGVRHCYADKELDICFECMERIREFILVVSEA